MPPSWRRLTKEKRRVVALYAAEHGLSAAAKKFVVSDTAVRTACAVNGLVPKRIANVETFEQRVAKASALLRSLRVTPQEVITHRENQHPRRNEFL